MEKHEWRFAKLSVRSNGIAKSTYNQNKGSRWSIFLHCNHTELLFRQCATRLSVAVLDIAFQVMWIVRSLHDKW